jgi:hypothetical protein
MIDSLVSPSPTVLLLNLEQLVQKLHRRLWRGKLKKRKKISCVGVLWTKIQTRAVHQASHQNHCWQCRYRPGRCTKPVTKTIAGSADSRGTSKKDHSEVSSITTRKITIICGWYRNEKCLVVKQVQWFPVSAVSDPTATFWRLAAGVTRQAICSGLEYSLPNHGA